MPSRVDIRAPATISLLAGGTAISSLGVLPPDGISIADPNSGGTLSVTLIAANAGASLSATGSGATIGGSGNTLVLTGNMTQVNAALAALVIEEPAGLATDTIRVTAGDTAAITGVTAIAVEIAAIGGPAFANPPASLAIAPGTFGAIAGLDLGDPGASGDAAAGQGGAQELVMTLGAASGLLFLPGYSALDGIAATGLGTGTIELSFSADRLAAVDSLIGGLELAAPAGKTGLEYGVLDLSDPDHLSASNGNISIIVTGATGPTGSFSAGGGQGLIQGAESLAAGVTLTIANTTGDLGGITGTGAVYIAPEATLELPYNNLTLGGSSYDFGTLAAGGFAENGALLLAEGATFGGALAFGSAALVLFDGNLVAGNNATTLDQLSITLSAGATLIGNGTITAGNFSESGVITGPGTIIAGPNETLGIDAGSIGGGALVEAAGGGVMILGPDDALQGIFSDTSLTVDSSVTLSFTGAPGLAPITGGFADALDSSGGVFVITGPQVFNGTILGFEPGDRLIFPGLSDASLFNITSNSFSIAGTFESQAVTYVFRAPDPADTSVFLTLDSEGDTEVGLRGGTVEVFLQGATIAVEGIETSPNVAQPIQGLDILTTAVSTLSYTVTLSVGHGILTVPGFAPAATLTLTAANPTALNNELALLSYTGTSSSGDVLTISAGTGPLAGLSVATHIYSVAPATLNGVSGLPTAADTAVYSGPSSLPNIAAAAPGEVIIHADTDFADALTIVGLGGTAILVDDAGAAVFDAAASVTTNANVVVGDSGGAGTLAIATEQFLVGGSLIAGGSGAAAGNLIYVPGGLTISGALQFGAGATTTLDLDGTLAAATVSLGPAGDLLAYDDATVNFGSLADAGVLTMIGGASGTANSINLTGGLALGGTAQLNDTGRLSVSAGAAGYIGPDALFAAVSLAQTGGAMTVGGTLTLSGGLAESGGAFTLAGGTVAAASVTIGAGATLVGDGILAPLGAITNAGTILASGGGLILGNDITNTGAIGIASSAALDVVHALTGGTIAFAGTNAELTINDLAFFSGSVASLTGHDVIDLVGIAPSLVSFASGSITASDTAHNKIGGFALGTVSGQPAISIVSDGFGGALVTLGDEMPCFARGTRLLTPTGYRPVETLKPGDALITAAGDRRAIRWIGSRTLDFSRLAARPALPVLIAANAIAPGVPSRPVRLSPLHAVAFAGVLVPAGHLVNGATIVRENARAAVTYLHVELERHDIVLADGLPCETYRDTGNRGALYREVGRRSPAGAACAPLITAGPKLAAIRRRLHAVALAAGFSLTYQPILRAVANDRTTIPEIRMKAGRRIARFALPPGARRLMLLSRSASPADTDPDSEDRRALAICLDQSGRNLPELGGGWLPRGTCDTGVWMGNSAELLLRQPADTLTLSLAAIIRTWRQPEPAVRP